MGDALVSIVKKNSQQPVNKRAKLTPGKMTTNDEKKIYTQTKQDIILMLLVT